MRKIIGSIVVILGMFVLYYVNINSQQSVAKMQNSLNLEFVNDCVKNEFNKLGKEPTSYNLTETLNICAKGLLSGGITGDIFVIRANDKKLFWDNSTDCKPGNELKAYMTSDGVCSLFKESESCTIAIDLMINNEPRGFTTWMFDDAREYVNYKYLYTTVEGNKYIIGQGTQSDELENNFFPVYVVAGIWGFILILTFNV